jgi:hypothetical protein
VEDVDQRKSAAASGGAIRGPVACFNYKIVDSVPIIFEMNPRVGASFTRVPDQYLEAYFESARWCHRTERAIEVNAEPSARRLFPFAAWL